MANYSLISLALTKPQHVAVILLLQQFIDVLAVLAMLKEYSDRG